MNRQVMLAEAGEASEATLPQSIDEASSAGASAETPLCAENDVGGGGGESGVAASDGCGSSSSTGERVDSPADIDVSCQNDATDGAWARPSDLEVALMMTCMAEAVTKESEVMVRYAFGTRYLQGRRWNGEMPFTCYRKLLGPRLLPPYL